jgi:hypothetical protein
MAEANERRESISLTHDEAKTRAEETVYVVMTAGSIMTACDAGGFEYRTNKDGHFAGGERSRCEQFLVTLITDRHLSGEG